MGAFDHLFYNADQAREDATRAQHHRDAERWRDEVRPRLLRRFAARTAKLQWSRALLIALVGELYPDDLFTALVGRLDRVPRQRWPQVIAIAIALRHSWRRDGLARLARRLRISLEETADRRSHRRPSRRRFSGSARSRQGFPLRSNPSRGSRP